MRHAAQIKLKVCVLSHDGRELSNDNDIARNSCSKTNDDAANWCLTDVERLLNKTQETRIRTKFQWMLLEKVNGVNANPVNDDDGVDALTELVSHCDNDHTHPIDEMRELFEQCLVTANAAASDSDTKCAAFRLYVEEMYKRYFFHHKYDVDCNRAHKMRCIYPTLSMIEHSCDPNCAIV